MRGKPRRAASRIPMFSARSVFSAVVYGPRQEEDTSPNEQPGRRRCQEQR